jgi:phosphomannomutase
VHEERQRIIERVQKLFALAAQNDSPEEAQLAAMRAQELLQKYDLNLSELDIKRGGSNLCGEQHIQLKKRNTPAWIKFLYSAVAEGFGVDCYRGLRLFDTILIYIGVEPDVTIAKQTFEYLYNFIETYDLNGKSAKQKSQWRMGFIYAVNTRFEEQRNKKINDAHSYGLMIVKDKIIKDYTSKKYKNINKARKLSKTKISVSFNEGVAVGMITPINRPIGGDDTG